MAGDLGAGQRERVRRNSLLRVTIMIKALFIIIGKPAVRARGKVMMYAVCGTQFMQGVDTGYRRPRRIRRRKTLLLSLNRYGAFMPASNQFSPSKHRQRELCNLNLKLSFCAKVSFSLLQILRDSRL